MTSLFSLPQKDIQPDQPLAERLRPKTLQEVIGQGHLLGESGSLQLLLKNNHLPSVVLWGPPGCGKTTIAKLLAHEVGYHFVMVSAVNSGTAELKKLFEAAKQHKTMGKSTLLMVDEIHRFNRAQQDVLLPFVEDGTVTLVGATTENPSFELNTALLSRCKVLVLNRLDNQALLSLMKRAENHIGKTLPLDSNTKETICAIADGDGRYLLGLCETLFSLKQQETLSVEQLLSLLQARAPVYDKHQDGHYNLISALHKSLRGSDVDAALYWFGRMLAGGEDPLYIIRRLVRFAVEDIGLADPQALVQANAAKEAYQLLGSPEGELAISQAVIYLATAPKSNAAYIAFKQSMHDAKSTWSLMPPKHILNAPTSLMKEQGYGKDYAYDHDEEDGFSGQNYFPDTMKRAIYYAPKNIGFEQKLYQRLDYWQKLRAQKKSC